MMRLFAASWQPGVMNVAKFGMIVAKFETNIPKFEMIVAKCEIYEVAASEWSDSLYAGEWECGPVCWACGQGCLVDTRACTLAGYPFCELGVRQTCVGGIFWMFCPWTLECV